ncbi:MAG: NAD+ synthase [Planctomycetota bacterium]|jgi:NAD+ synthase
MAELKIDPKATFDYLVAFLNRNIHAAGFERAVLGLSGGVDSSLSLTLATAALGSENVRALFMPYRTSHPDSKRHAILIAEKTGVDLIEEDISPQIDLYYQRYPEADEIRRGNKMARERMTILFDHSAAFNGLVVGTSNRTEILLGYGTLHGDTVSAINPLGSLYKTQIFDLAEYSDIPEEIVKKPPSADLWTGQTDEGELGFTYKDVDRLLFHMIDQGKNDSDLEEAGFEPAFIGKIRAMVARFDFKRRPALIAEIPADVLKP